MTARLHGKAQLVPADYEFEGYFDSATPQFEVGLGVEFYASMMAAYRAERAAVEKQVEPYSLNTCRHCGAAIRHAVIYRHKSGEYIVVGETCARERMSLTTHDDVVIRSGKLAAIAREQKAKVHAGTIAWIAENADLWERMKVARGDSFVADLTRAVVKYGSLTDRQFAAIGPALEKIEEWTVPGAACEVNFSGEPAPEGRVEIEGEVISVKWQENQWGSTPKMTVAVDAGFKVWVTVPDAIYSVEKGQRVKFTATLTQSDRDPRFAFGKRPTKAEVVS
jgi:hypothetical protein